MRAAERQRMAQLHAGRHDWRRWGPYLAERQWGTVREDYSADGNAWDYFPHDHARSRAYRWGEDGIGGIQRRPAAPLLRARALERRRPDPQGAAVRPHRAGGQSRRGRQGALLLPRRHADALLHAHALQVPAGGVSRTRELVAGEPAPRREASRSSSSSTPASSTTTATSTSFVEYAKAAPEDILHPHHASQPRPGGGAAHRPAAALVPQHLVLGTRQPKRPSSRAGLAAIASSVTHPTLRRFSLHCDAADRLALHRQRDQRAGACSGPASPKAFFKDGFHELIVNGDEEAVESRRRSGPRRRPIYALRRAGRRRGRASACASPGRSPSRRRSTDFDDVFAAPRSEADEFYARCCHAGIRDEDARRVQRQALAGMLWSKQFYLLRRAASGWTAIPAQPPPPPERKHGRNHEWLHLYNADVISMPDKWEYPWFAAWDLAFHCVAAGAGRSGVRQGAAAPAAARVVHAPQRPAAGLRVGLRRREPAGACLGGVARLQDRRAAQRRDEGDRDFLERVFHKLLLNFTWWVNRKDAAGPQRLPGRLPRPRQHRRLRPHAPLPDGGHIEQADGTSWMAMYCLNLLRDRARAGAAQPGYEDIATKFFEHFLYIARRDEQPRRRGDRPVGRARTASSTTCCTSPDGRHAVRSRFARWSA